MTLPEKIVKHRKENGWSQEELAERLYVSRQAVSRWENGLISEKGGFPCFFIQL